MVHRVYRTHQLVKSWVNEGHKTLLGGNTHREMVSFIGMQNIQFQKTVHVV